ncbi:MAG: M48 family metallopeptidase [Gammaproteobacteria bacterium]
MNILHYGTQQIPYQITKTKARRRLTIKISADLQLSAHAPLKMSDAEIHAFIVSKSAWIVRKLKEFEKHHQVTPVMPSREYVNGETFYYLGQQYLLQIYIEANVMPSVQLKQDTIVVTMSKNNARWVKTLIKRFYQQQAQIVLADRLQQWVNVIPWITEIPELSFRTMKSRWGSCSHDKKIRLNYHLIKAPLECIDHVILHELCHLKVMNHSDKFYRLLVTVEPNWKKTKKQLDKLGHLLMDD